MSESYSVPAMRVFGLSTGEDFIIYMIVLIIGTIPVMGLEYAIALLFNPDFFDASHYLSVELFQPMDAFIFFIIPTFSAILFFKLNTYTKLYISKDYIRLENRKGNSVKYTSEDIEEFIVYKLPVGQGYGDVIHKEVSSPGYYPIGIKIKNSGSVINIYGSGEIWNVLRVSFSNTRIRATSFFNRNSLILSTVSALQALGIFYLIHN